MALVLAIESDPRQAGILRRTIRDQVPADLVVSDSKDSAIASIAQRLPDLILVSALMSPREEAELTEHLRGLEDTGHLQTLTIPLLASKPVRRAAGSKVLRALKWRRALALEGCDPSVFADEIRGYLERARELRAQCMLERRAEEDVAIARAEETATARAGTEPSVMEQPLIDPVVMPVEPCEPTAECQGAPATPSPTDAAEVPEPAVQPADEVEFAQANVSVAGEPPPIPMATLREAALARTDEAPATNTSIEPLATEQPPIDPVAMPVEPCEPTAACQGAPATPSPTDAVEIPESAVQRADEVELDRQEVPLAIDPPLAPMTASDAVVSGQRQEPPAPDVVLQSDAREQPAATVAATGMHVPSPIELRQPLPESAEQEPQLERRTPSPPAAEELSESLKQDCKWIASAIDALRQDSQRARAKRADGPPMLPATPGCAPPPVEQVRIEEPAAPPTTAASGKRVLRLVKTEKRHLPKQRVAASSATCPSPAKRHAPKPARPALIEDEWGIHDPRECGFDALMARLDATAPGDPAAEEEETASPASPPRRRGARVTPLAIWAHAGADDLGTDAEQDDLRGLFACLALPAGIAAVSYPTGCRIRRVRVAPRAHAKPRTDLEKKTIILSRKLLRKLQQRDEASRTQVPA